MHQLQNHWHSELSALLLVLYIRARALARSRCVRICLRSALCATQPEFSSCARISGVIKGRLRRTEELPISFRGRAPSSKRTRTDLPRCDRVTRRLSRMRAKERACEGHSFARSTINSFWPRSQSLSLANESPAKPIHPEEDLPRLREIDRRDRE